MYGILGPRQTRVRLSHPQVAGGLEAATLDFLKETRQSALGRFAGRNPRPRSCLTVQRGVPARPGADGCIGTIVVHVSAPVANAWAAQGTGMHVERKAQVAEQLQLVLQDLCDQDVHGYLSLTDTQCDVYGHDLVQLVTESLGRTTFPQLGRACDVHWEGTLVRSLQPPALVLVVSIGFWEPGP